jgi:hypothetical protein
LWCRRLAIELGEVAIPNALPPLPPAFPASVQAYWRGYRLLVACERLSGSDAWPLYTHTFAARWCGLQRTTARLARDVLMKANWLETTGDVVVVGGFKEAHRFQPGRAVFSSSRRCPRGRR